MDVSILLPTRKNIHILQRSLENFRQINSSDIEWEIIVIDNIGDMETREIVEKYSDQLPLKYILEEKKGKNNALNAGLDKASGELLAFVDDDILVSNNWLQEIWKGQQRWRSNDIFGGRILPLFPDNKLPDLDMDDPFVKGAFAIADWDIKEGEYEPDMVWGGNMAVRARIFRQGNIFNAHIGPCGTNYIMGSETEFTRRMFRQGHIPVFLPGVQVLHIIREEQLEPDWLFKRSFRAGRGSAIRTGKPRVKQFLNIPRFMFMNLAKLYAMYFLALLSGSKRKRVENGMKLWREIGMMYQYRKGLDSVVEK